MTPPTWLNGTILFGGLTTFALTLWGTTWARIREMVSQMEGLFLDRHVVQSDNTVIALTDFIVTTRKPPLGSKRYMGIETLYVAGKNCFMSVVYEYFQRNSRWLWVEGRPYYVVFESQGAVITALRGFGDPLRVLCLAAEHSDRIRENRVVRQSNRFSVTRVSGDPWANAQGVRGESASGGGPVPAAPRPNGKTAELVNDSAGALSSPFETFNFAEGRLIAHNVDKSQLRPFMPGKAMPSLVLPPRAIEMAEEVRRFIESYEWYQQRQIAWTMGLWLYGPTGTGKTSYVRALAQDNNVPIVAYDLATMSNEDLMRHWQSMAHNVPVIALFEDLDGVFDGRVNRNSANLRNALTFDCFLNCLDGVQGSHGVIKIATTNHIEKMDSALGVAVGAACSSRPGRFDVAVELPLPDESGRRRLVRQVLGEHWWEVEPMVEKTDGMSPAQVQYLATQVALDYFWGRKSRPLQYGDRTDQTMHELDVAVQTLGKPRAETPAAG